MRFILRWMHGVLLWILIRWYRHRARVLGEEILAVTADLSGGTPMKEFPECVSMQVAQYMDLREWLVTHDPSFPKS